ncbi:hypothetical protein GCM10027343_32700 [Noviherbaspirillum agri]
MIESRYWKEDLLAHARRLQPVRAPKRWTERTAVNFEKELMISFFMVRVLLERNKLSTKLQQLRIPVARYPWNGEKITVLNAAFVDELYHFDQGSNTSVSLGFISNQFVHAGAIYAERDESRNWSHVLLCSDFERKKAIFRVAVPEIQRIFHLVAEDQASWVRLQYDPKLGDYRVEHG